MEINWLLWYGGCKPNTGCMGPPEGWYLLGVPLNLFLYMILFTFVISPVVYLTFHILKGLITKKREKGSVLKKNYKKVILTFLVLLILEILFINWFLYFGVVY
jgi:hypothetical protein